MVDGSIGLAAMLLTLGSSALVALRLAGRSSGTLVLGTYVIWVGQITLLSLGLSVFGALGRPGYVIGAALVCAVATTWQILRPAPRVGVVSSARAYLREIRRDRVLAVLGAIVALELAYAAAIVILTAPADDDSLQYHLARQAVWLQQGSVGTFAEAFDFRWNAFPPNADLVYAFVLSVTGGERLVEGVNVLAAGVLAVAVTAGARRLGFDRREALFGALLAASFPVVALQAPSTLTDLQVAALVCSGAALLLRRVSGDLVLGSAALAVVLGAKVTGAFAIPVLGVVGWLTWRPRWGRAVTAIAVAVLVGSYWYVWNAARVGSLAGETPADERGEADPVVAAAQTMRLGINAFDLPGAVGHDIFVYPLAALVLAAAGAVALAWRRRLRGWTRDLVLAAALVALIPLLAPIGDAAQRVYRKVWWQAGRPDLVALDADRVETFASSMQSGAGPVGLLLVVIGSVLALREIRRKRLRWAALGLALAPVLWIVMIGTSVAYFRWSSRYALPGFALAAMTWGVVLRVRWLATGLVTCAAATLLLSYTHFFEKPAGIRLLEPRTQRSAFTTPRAETMAWDPEIVPLLRYIEEELPADASVAVFPVFFPRRADMPPTTAPELLVYPVFGPSLDRRVSLAVDPEVAARTHADWYLAPSYTVRGCVPGWRSVAERSAWTVLRRAPGQACPR
jgi:hypothetical protein